MAINYDYLLSVDFTSGLDSAAFQTVIENTETISPTILRIDVIGDVVKIVFDSALAAGEETTLNGLVTSYVYVEIVEPVSSSRQAIVSKDIDKPGDFTSIADAFAAGAKSVFVKNGIYYETSDIVIPNYGQLIGESLGGVVIALVAGNSIKCDGSDGAAELTGTMDISKDSKSVTGTGTLFTNASVGDFLLIGTNYFTIGSIESDTALTLIDTYRGKSLTDQSFRIQPMHTGINIENMTVASSTSVGLYLRGLRHISVKAVAFGNCTGNIEIHECGDIGLSTIVSNFASGIGIVISNSVSVSLNTVSCFNSTSYGFNLKGDCCDIIMEACASENNSADGFRIEDSCNGIRMLDCIAKYNDGCGVCAIDTTTSNIVVKAGDIFNNGGIGVDVHGSISIVSGNEIIQNDNGGVKMTGKGICHNNIISGNTGIGISITAIDYGTIITGNSISISTGTGIHIDHKNAVIANNGIVAGSAKGLYLSANADDCIVIGNMISGNVGNGLEIETGAVDNICTSNNCKGNTGTNLLDNGTTSTLANNKS